jgi:hypothetical protein
LEVLAGLFLTREAPLEENRVVIGRKVFSHVMAYLAGYFGCTCQEDFKFF